MKNCLPNNSLVPFIFLLLIINPYFGAGQTISGQVQDSLSGEPLVNANIWDAENKKGTSTDEFGEDGYFVTQARVIIWQDGALIDSCREIEKGHYRSFHPEKYESNADYEVRITAPELPEVHVSDIRIPRESLVEPDQFSFRLEKDKESAYLEVSFQNPEHYAVYEGKAYYDSHEINEVSMGPIYVDNLGSTCEADAIFISNKCKAGDTFTTEYYIELYKISTGVWEK